LIKKHESFSTKVFLKKCSSLIVLRRPYTKATIGNMLPATFFSNDRQLKNVAGNMPPTAALMQGRP
jgi:hypothetical protein